MKTGGAMQYHTTAAVVFPARQANSLGEDLPFWACRDLIGRNVDGFPQTDPGVKWVGIIKDICFCRYPLGNDHVGGIRLFQWLDLLKGQKTHIYFNGKDSFHGPVFHLQQFGSFFFSSRTSFRR